MTWEGERGHRGGPCIHQSGQCPIATQAITARQGLFSTLNSDPSRFESFSLLRDIKQLLNFSFSKQPPKSSWSHMGSVSLKKQGYSATVSLVYYFCSLPPPPHCNHVIWWLLWRQYEKNSFFQSRAYLRENLIAISSVINQFCNPVVNTVLLLQ